MEIINKEGEGVKYTDKQVCWNVGSVAYGFWVYHKDYL